MLALIYLLIAAALGAGLTGVWIVGESLLGGQRRFAERLRRLSEPRAMAANPGAEPDGEAEASAFARFIERRFPGIRRRLQAAGAPFTAVQVVLGSVGLFFGFLVLLTLVRLPFLAALGLSVWGGFAGPLLLISWLARRRRAQFTQQMPQAVDLIARSLQAGHPVTTAMTVAARQMPDPIGPEFEMVMAEINLGQDRDVALRNLLQRFPIPELRMFAASMEVTRESGGDLAEVFLKLGDTMRSKGQLRKKVAALSAEGRMTFWIVSLLPLGVVGSLMLLRPEYYATAAKDPHFLPLITVSPTLWAIGALMIWRMINFRI